MSEPNPPPGFEPLFRTSPFLETVGPLFYRKDPERGLVIGLRIAEKHANARGIAHGGLLMTLPTSRSAIARRSARTRRPA